MRKPSSSNRVSGIQRFAAIARQWARSARHGSPAAAGTSGALPAQDLVDLDATGPEGFAHDRDASVRAGLAAHEYVESGIAGVGPGMDRDVALGEHRDAGHPGRLGM